jgi:hypothetical protein
MKPPVRSTRGRKGASSSPSASPSPSPSASPSPLPTTETERAPIRPPLLSSYVPFIPRPAFSPNIIRLPSRNAEPNISLAGLRTELLTGRTIILYDDDVPPSDAEEEDEPPPLASREDSSDEEEDEVEVAEDKNKYAHCRQPRKSYSVTTKKSYLKKIRGYKTEHPLVSIRSACDKFALNESLYWKWAKKYDVLQEEEDECPPVPQLPAAHVIPVTPADAFLQRAKKARLGRIRKEHSGPISLLHEHTELLLRFIFELREQGHGVNTALVVRKASLISRVFREKTTHAKRMVVSRWLKIQGLRFRMGTHESQRPPAETRAEALDYIINIARVKCQIVIPSG